MFLFPVLPLWLAFYFDYTRSLVLLVRDVLEFGSAERAFPTNTGCHEGVENTRRFTGCSCFPQSTLCCAFSLVAEADTLTLRTSPWMSAAERLPA